MARIFISIGSNTDPKLNFEKCAKALEQFFDKLRWSPIYQTKAIGMEGDDFLNAVVEAHTNHPINVVDQFFKDLENKQGRIRTDNKFSDRTLDVDLLLYDDSIINAPNITLPRAEITTEFHVLVPLVDLAPTAVHPSIGRTYSELLTELKQQQPNYETLFFKTRIEY